MSSDLDIEKVRELCKKLRSIVSSSDVAYIEGLLRMGIDKAIAEDPVATFLALLESFAGYVQHVVMVREVLEKLRMLGAEDVLIPLSSTKYVRASEFVEKHPVEKIDALYRKLFIEEREVIERLVSMVRKFELRRRFEESFLWSSMGKY